MTKANELERTGSCSRSMKIAMSNILNIAIKDFKLLARDRLSLFFIFVFPVAMGLLFGAITGSFSSRDVTITLGVVDEDQSEMSQRFVKRLDENARADVVQRTRDEAMNDVRRGRLVGMIAIPKGFGQNAGIFWEEQTPLQVGVDPSRQASRRLWACAGPRQGAGRADT